MWCFNHIYIYIYVYVYIYESHSIGVMNSSLWILPPFPTNPTIKATNRAAALPRHPQDQHHTTVLEGIGDAAAVDQTTGCIVLAKGIPPRGDPRLQPQRCGKMGCVSWGYHGNRYNIYIYIYIYYNEYIYIYVYQYQLMYTVVKKMYIIYTKPGINGNWWNVWWYTYVGKSWVYKGIWMEYSWDYIDRNCIDRYVNKTIQNIFM